MMCIVLPLAGLGGGILWRPAAYSLLSDNIGFLYDVIDTVWHIPIPVHHRFDVSKEFEFPNLSITHRRLTVSSPGNLDKPVLECESNKR